jgi:hypothetical protein
MRWYFYTSPDWENTNIPGSCTNGKRGRLDAITLSLQPLPGDQNKTYNYAAGTGWRPFAYDCCQVGPYNTGENPGPDITAYRGKWWRFEVVVTNRFGGTGTGWRVQVFQKNITDGGTEARVIDSNGTNTGGSPWSPSPSLTPPEVQTEGDFPMIFTLGPYRSGTCAGWQGFSHFMVAQWDTDTGQRIGPAYEIEGGGSLPSVPTSPSGLRVR